MTRYNKPISNLIKRILIGKIFYWNKGYTFVIIGVRRNSLHGYLEILIGRYPYNKKYGYGRSISVYSWYAFQPKQMCFVGRNSKEIIRNCLKTNPKYINYHTGKQIDSSKFVLVQNQPISSYPQDRILIYDNNNYYFDYLKTL